MESELHKCRRSWNRNSLFTKHCSCFFFLFLYLFDHFVCEWFVLWRSWVPKRRWSMDEQTSWRVRALEICYARVVYWLLSCRSTIMKIIDTCCLLYFVQPVPECVCIPIIIVLDTVSFWALNSWRLNAVFEPRKLSWLAIVGRKIRLSVWFQSLLACLYIGHSSSVSQCSNVSLR